MEAIRGAIGWLSLPFDIQTLWNFFWRWIAPALPGLVSIVLGYLYHAPYWQIALLAGSFFALFYLGMFGIVALRRRALSSVLTDAPTRSVRTARAVSTQDEAVGKMRRDPLQVEEETDEEFLIRRCRQLANELHEFLKERGHGEGVEVDDPGDPKMVQRSNETVGLYRTRFEGEILARYEVLKERGWWGDELLDEFGRNRVENVTYYGDIRAIAQRLSAIGHRP